MNLEEIAKFLLTAGKLKALERSGWVREGMPNPETVAEHSWRVALLALVLAKHLGIDHHRLVEMALIHDFEEIETQDPVTQRGKKQLSNHDSQQERKIVGKILEGLPDFEEIYSLWEAHIPENGPEKTRESDILYQLGKIATAWQALEYELGGADPRKLDEFWENAWVHVKEPNLKRLLKELKNLRKKKS